MDDAEAIARLDVRVRQILSIPGLHRIQTCWVKERARRVWKSASILYFGKSADAITHREFHVQKWVLAESDFERTEHWYCRDDEVDKLHAFISTELGQTGDFAVLKRTEQIAALLDHVAQGDVDSGLLSEIAAKLAERVEFVSTLDSLRGAELLGMAVDLKRRQVITDELAGLIADRSTAEPQLQAVLEQNWWLLGASYVGQADRRQLTMLDQFDLPLIRADGVLHIVELKRANVPNVVVPHRKHFRVGNPVNEAVGQVANYLRESDELTDVIRSRHGIECRRAQATVIIGHPDHNGRADTPLDKYREAIRTYNSHLSRIEVLTYEDLIVTARQATGALAERVSQEAARVEIGPEE